MNCLNTAKLLSDSIKEFGISDPLREEWLDADRTFKRALMKASESDCTLAYPNQPILNFKR